MVAVLLLASAPNTVVAETTPEIPPNPPVDYASPILKRICSCESTGQPNNEPRQFNTDGSVVKGKINPLDTGACQVNLKYHEAASEKFGYDLFTRDGNISYANHLYQEQGTQPWSWSRGCWAA